MKQNKYQNNPKFIHNLWMRSHANPELTYLTSLQGVFEVSTKDAEEFMVFRKYCTGHNSVEEISLKSGVNKNRIIEVVASFNDIGIIRPKEYDINLVSTEDIIDKFLLHDRK